MRCLFFILFVLFAGCQEKEASPVGREYLLVDADTRMPITLGFNPDGRFYGKAVNEYWGQYHIHDNIISFSGITHTMKSDIFPKMRAERLYFEHLTNGHSFEMENRAFKIFFDETGVLEFQQNSN